MKERILGALLLVLIFVPLLLLGDWLLALGLCAMSIVGEFEFARAMAAKGHVLFFIPQCVLTVLWYAALYLWKPVLPETGRVLGAYAGTAVVFLIWCIGSLILFMILAVLGYPKRTLTETACSFLSLLYVAGLLSFVWLLREREAGLWLVGYLFAAAWGSDIFAYFAGRLFGRRKLAPELSPKKTVAGAVGGLLGGVILCLACGWAFSRFGTAADTGLPLSRILWVSAAAGAVGALLGMTGDLFASSVKRQTGVKDFGKLIPGHGGILDRFDSILMAAPAVWLVLALFMK